MRRVLFLVLAIITLGTAGAKAQQRGDMSVGLNINYGAELEAFGIGAEFKYNITNSVRIAPSFTYFFEDNCHWNLDVNANYLVPISSTFVFYPVGGFSLSTASNRGANGTTKLGVNLGAGIECKIIEKLMINLDVIYNTTPNRGQSVFRLGVAYRFN